jgi:fluoride exporter
MNMKMPLLLILFGSIGVLGRYYLDQNISPAPNGFPLSTFVINILGSFLIGFLYVAVTEKSMIEPDLGLALTIGLLGGFTTFSAYSLQIFRLYEQGSASVALVYAVLSPILGILAAGAAVFGARLLFK